MGNKKAVKQFLPALAKWQRNHGYPFEFSTEASVNLADDDQLLQLMRAANFMGVFIGIESPDTDTLVSMQKKQNTRRSLRASVHKIYGAGMFVTAGFILGFDSEKGSVAEGMIASIEETAIPICMVGLLHALPGTQLTRRLAREGRLFAGNRTWAKSDRRADWYAEGGLNFDTARPRREILADYVHVLERIYGPDAYFARVKHVGRHLRLPPAEGLLPLTPGELLMSVWLLWYLLWKRPWLIGRFWATALDCFMHNRAALKSVMMLMALYIHLGSFAATVAKALEAQIARLDEGAWQPPPRVPIPAASPPALRAGAIPAKAAS